MKFLKGKPYSFKRDVNLYEDPLKTFAHWFERASKTEANPTAMVYSNIEGGKPKSRMVLLKHFDKEGFLFFSHRRKLLVMDNNYVQLLFHWDTADLQVSISGFVREADDEVADDYWSQRNRFSRAVSLISPQSTEIEAPFSFLKDILPATRRVKERPDHWIGYQVVPLKYEFWQGGSMRMNIRNVYEWQPRGLRPHGVWITKLLAP